MMVLHYKSSRDMKKKIYNQTVEELSNAEAYDFPKYTTQIINLVNSNAQGTRPAVVGQMSELIQAFPGKSLTEWIEWYSAQQPNAVNNATEKIWSKLQEMKDALTLIDKPMVESWVKDLVYTKTYCGLKFQEAILAYLAREYNTTYRLATIEEEAQGIDGYVNNRPAQIKSITYKQEALLAEVINVPIIFYDKKKDGINIEFEPNDFGL
jgi:probable type-2 restriction enzyme mthZI